MAQFRKFIALTRIKADQYQICLFKRRKAKSLACVEILIDDFPFSSSLANEKMSQLSQQLKIPWQKEILDFNTTKKLPIKEKRRRRKQSANNARLAARAGKPPLLTFDGTSLGRPGRAAAAGVIEMPDFSRHTVTKFMKSSMSNEAEYTGLIIGLEKAKDLGISKLQIKGDSQMVINQVLGKYKIKLSSSYQSYCDEVLNLLSYFDKYTLSWTPRRKNQIADRAAHKCLKENCPVDDSKTYLDYIDSSYLQYLV